MRCLHFLKRVRLEIGGVVRAVLDYCAVMAERGHAVTLLTWDAEAVPEEWRDPEGHAKGRPVVKVLGSPPLPGGIMRPGGMREARELIARSDVVHLHGPWEPANVQVASAARRAGVPYVVTVHGMLDDWCMGQKSLKKRLVHRFATRKFLDQAATIHCTAEGELAQAKRWFSNARTSVLPYVFDLSPFRELPGRGPAERAFPVLKEGGRNVLFLSRLHPKKGVEHLIDAVALLHQRGSFDARLLIAGAGEADYEAALGARVQRLGLGDRVQFFGMITGVEKVSVYQCADLFVLPTSQENFGIVFAEAMACGVPVVTTRGVDIWPELQRGGAELVEQRPEALAEVMGRLLGDPEELRRRGARGKAFVFEWLNTEKLAVAYEELYRAAAGKMLITPVR